MLSLIPSTFAQLATGKNPQVGYPIREAEKMLADFGDDMRDGLVTVVEVDMINILVTGERISKMRTFASGHRGFDILHVVTAIDLDAKDFLSFDGNQNGLALAEGLKAPLGAA